MHNTSRSEGLGGGREREEAVQRAGSERGGRREVQAGRAFVQFSPNRAVLLRSGQEDIVTNTLEKLKMPLSTPRRGFIERAEAQKWRLTASKIRVGVQGQ